MPDSDTAFIRDLICYRNVEDHRRERLRRFRWGEQSEGQGRRDIDAAHRCCYSVKGRDDGNVQDSRADSTHFLGGREVKSAAGKCTTARSGPERFILISIMLVILVSGCEMMSYRDYPSFRFERDDAPLLTFTVPESAVPGYFRYRSRLSLRVSEMEPDGTGHLKRGEYLGSIQITKEQHRKTIPLPAGRTVRLTAFHNSFGEYCNPACLLTPQRGASYVLEYRLSKDDRTCWLTLSKDRAGKEKDREVISSTFGVPTTSTDEPVGHRERPVDAEYTPTNAGEEETEP